MGKLRLRKEASLAPSHDETPRFHLPLWAPQTRSRFWGPEGQFRPGSSPDWPPLSWSLCPLTLPGPGLIKISPYSPDRPGVFLQAGRDAVPSEASLPAWPSSGAGYCWHNEIRQPSPKVSAKTGLEKPRPREGRALPKDTQDTVINPIIVTYSLPGHINSASLHPNPKRWTLLLSHFTGIENCQDSISCSLALDDDPVLPQMVSPYLSSGNSPASPFSDTKKTEPFVKKVTCSSKARLPVPAGGGWGGSMVSGCCPRPLPDLTSQHSLHLPLLSRTGPGLPPLLSFVALLLPFPLPGHRTWGRLPRLPAPL